MINLLEPEIPSLSKKYVNDCLDTGWLSYAGDYVKQLECLTKDYLGLPSAIAASSGTGGLWLALKALGIGPGDFVCVPSMTFVATVNSVIHTGATPVFIDCDDNLQMSIEHLAKAVATTKPKAIIPVHMLGNIGDMLKIRQIADKNKVLVLEDAAQALGSKRHGEFAGTFGDVSMFSYSFNKIIAAGQGGMIVAKDKILGDRLKYLSLQAKDDAEIYLHNESGFNMGMSNINAALACGQMENIRYVLEQKRRVRDKYVELLGEDKMYCQEGSNGWLNAYKSQVNWRIISNRLKDKGIQTRPLFYPNHQQAAFTNYPYFGENKTLNKWLYTICLPSSTNLTDEQIKDIVKLIRGDK